MGPNSWVVSQDKLVQGWKCLLSKLEFHTLEDQLHEGGASPTPTPPQAVHLAPGKQEQHTLPCGPHRGRPATSCNACGTVPHPPLGPVSCTLSSGITNGRHWEGWGVLCPGSRGSWRSAGGGGGLREQKGRLVGRKQKKLLQSSRLARYLPRTDYVPGTQLLRQGLS